MIRYHPIKILIIADIWRYLSESINGAIIFFDIFGVIINPRTHFITMIQIIIWRGIFASSDDIANTHIRPSPSVTAPAIFKNTLSFESALISFFQLFLLISIDIHIVSI